MRRDSQQSYRFTVAAFLLIILLTPASRVDAAQIEPPDVFKLVSQISAKIEKLRWYMGRPKLGQGPPKVRNVAPHEVFFQAMTLFEKTNRLAFELTLVNAEPPTIPEGAITPGNVYTVVQAAQLRLQHIEYSMGINLGTTNPPRENFRTPTDVFKAVVQANRQLNQLMDKRFSPSDVYRQVTVALSYADRILAGLPNVAPPPEPTQIIPGKLPVDVYRQLLNSYKLIVRIGEKRGRKTLVLDSWTADEEHIRPSDVFDIASLLVSELSYIHKTFPGAQPPRNIVWQRGKFPSDVYQRAVVLENLLKEVLKRLP